ETESGLDYNVATGRWDPPFQAKVLDPSASQLGIVTKYGLKVTYPGLKITLKPWVQHSRKWPWSLYVRCLVENQLFCRSTTGEWFTISSYLRGGKIASWTWKDWTDRDNE